MSRPCRLLAAFIVLLPILLSLVAAPLARAGASVAAPAQLLAAPFGDSGVLLALEPGTELTIDGAPEGAFYPVTAVGVSGWIDGNMIRVDKTSLEPAPEEIEAYTGEPPAETAAWEEPTATDPAAPEATPAPESTADAPGGAGESVTIVSDGPSTSDSDTGESGGGQPDATANAVPASTEAEQPSDTTGGEPPVTDTSSDPVDDNPGPAEAAPSETPVAVEPAPAPAPTSEAPPADSAPPAVSPAAEPADPDPKQPEMRRNGPTTVLVDAPLLDSPDPHSGLVFTVPAGSTFNLYGDEANGYLYGEFMWMFGWIRADQLDAAERVREERIPENVETVDTRTPKPGAGTAWTTVDLTLRAGPSAAEDSLGTVPAGTRVELTGVMQNDFQRVVHNGEVGWLSNAYLELPKDPEPELNANGRPEWTEREIIKIIEEAADRYGQPREDMLRVARCESNLDPYAVNPSGSYGLFQFVRSTWESTPFADKDIFDPEANSNAAGWMWQQGRRSEWVCQ
jgi:hypothetical protein